MWVLIPVDKLGKRCVAMRTVSFCETLPHQKYPRFTHYGISVLVTSLVSADMLHTSTITSAMRSLQEEHKLNVGTSTKLKANRITLTTLVLALTCIWVVAGSNFGRHSDYPDWVLYGLSQFPQPNSRILPGHRCFLPHPLQFTTFMTLITGHYMAWVTASIINKKLWEEPISYYPLYGKDSTEYAFNFSTVVCIRCRSNALLSSCPARIRGFYPAVV
jgi:hypothetical protein